MKRLVICTNVRPAVDIVTITVFTLHGNVSLTLNLVPLKTIIHSLRPMQRRRAVADAVPIACHSKGKSTALQKYVGNVHFVVKIRATFTEEKYVSFYLSNYL